MAADPTQFPVNKAVDAVAAGAILGTIMGWLPAVASALSIVWFLIQIYESKTFKKWNDAWRARRKAKKVARLKAKLAKLAHGETP